MSTAITRTEHDLPGNREVPADTYYGVLKIGRIQSQHTGSGRA